MKTPPRILGSLAIVIGLVLILTMVMPRSNASSLCSQPGGYALGISAVEQVKVEDRNDPITCLKMILTEQETQVVVEPLKTLELARSFLVTASSRYNLRGTCLGVQGIVNEYVVGQLSRQSWEEVSTREGPIEICEVDDEKR